MPSPPSPSTASIRILCSSRNCSLLSHEMRHRALALTAYGAEDCCSATMGPWKLPDPGEAGGPAITQHPFFLAHAPWAGKIDLILLLPRTSYHEPIANVSILGRESQVKCSFWPLNKLFENRDSGVKSWLHHFQIV